MKCTRTILFLLFFINPYISGHTIEPTLKFGKPSNDELKMTVYEPDTTATAIVLYDIGKSNYRYINNEFVLITQRSVKIKILKSEGKQYADINIPYYAPEQTSENRDNIYDLEAYAHNLENGKRVKTATKNNFIVRERINERYMQLKFSIPAVKEGTVIEYRYKQASDYYLQLEDWVMQTEIPTIYSEYSILIPNIFIFNIEMQGRDRIKVKEKDGGYTIEHTTLGGLGQVKKTLSVHARELTFTAHHLPALPDDEEYIWCSNDHKVSVSFDLQGVKQGENYKSYTQTWEDIDNFLLKEDFEDFGQQLFLFNPYHEEMAALQLTDMPFEKRVEATFKLLKQKMTWNGEYKLYSPDLKKTIKKGTGSNADLNFIFINMLRDCGIEAWPVVLRMRNTGRLPIHYPSLQKLNTFVVAIHTDKQKIIYLDCSMPEVFPNVLPEKLTVEKARIINRLSDQEKWVDLTRISNNTISITIRATLTPEQLLTGTQEIKRTGHFAFDRIHQYKQAKDSIDFIRKHEVQNDCHITNYTHKEIDAVNNSVYEAIQFTRKADNANEEYLYINPMLFTHISKNPFIQADRVMPIDLPQAYMYTVTNTLILPEGYQIEEIPKSQVYITEKKGISCHYYIEKEERIIRLKYMFIVKQLHFEPAEYPNLQALWAATAEKNNALIVLKKL